MPGYETKYIFSLEVQGKEAVAQAQAIRDAIGTTLGKLDIPVEGMQQFAKALTLARTEGAKLSEVAKGIEQVTNALRQQAAIQQQTLRRPSGLTGGIPGEDLSGMYQRVEQEKEYQRLHMANVADQNRLDDAQAEKEMRNWAQRRLQGQYLIDETRKWKTSTVAAAPRESMWDAFNRGVDDATKKVWGLRRAAYGIESFGRAVLRTSLAAAAGVAASVAAYTAYNEAVTRAGMAMNLTADLQDKLTEKVLATAIALGKFDPSDVAAGMRYWAEGVGEVVTTEAQLDRMLQDTSSIQKMAAINTLALGDAVTFVGSALKEFSLGVQDTEMVTEIMNYVAATTFARVSDIGQAFKLVGPVANSMGISFSEVASALALVSDQNIKGTMAGRAMRQMFIQMLKPSDDYNKTMNTMLGISADMGEAWKNIVFPGGQFVGLANYIDILAESVEGLTVRERNERLAMLATANELPALTSLVNQQVKARENGINVLSAYQKVMTGVVDSEVIEYKRLYEAQTGLPFSLEGAHARMTGMWDKYEASDAFRVQQMQRRWQTLFIQVGDAATNYLLPRVEEASNAIAKMGKVIQDNPAIVGQGIEMIKWAAAIGFVVQSFGFLTKSATNFIVLGAGIREVVKYLREASILSAGAASAILPTLFTGAGVATAGILNFSMSQLNPQLIRTAAGASVSVLFPQFVGAIQEAWENYPGWRLGIRLLTPKMFFAAPEMGMIEDFKQSVQPFFNSAADWIVEGWQKIRDIWAESSGQALVGAKIATPIYDAYLEEQKRVAAQGKRLGTREAAEYTSFLNEQAIKKQNADLETLYDERRQIEQKAADQRIEILKNEAQNAGYAAQDYRNARLKAQEQYDFGMQRTMEDRADADRKRQEDFNRGEVEAAQDHFRQMRDMALQHRDRLIDLVETRDVRGIVKEMRDYKRQRASAQENYKAQSRQRQDDHARQQAEEAESRQKEDARRREDFVRQETEAADSYAKQNQRRRDALAERLADLQEALPKELLEWDKTHAAEIQKMEDALKTEDTLQREAATKFDAWRMERAIRGAWYAPVEPLPGELPPHAPGTGPQAGTGLPVGEPQAGPRLPMIPKDQQGGAATGLPGDWGQWNQQWSVLGNLLVQGLLAQVSQAGFLPSIVQPPGMGRQEGGYAPGGQYTLGERGPEYVLSAPTTRLLETQWGKLSQPLFINKASRGEGASAFTYAPTFHGMGAEDKAWYAMVARREAEKIINEKTGGYRR